MNLLFGGAKSSPKSSPKAKSATKPKKPSAASTKMKQEIEDAGSFANWSLEQSRKSSQKTSSTPKKSAAKGSPKGKPHHMKSPTETASYGCTFNQSQKRRTCTYDKKNSYLSPMCKKNTKPSKKYPHGTGRCVVEPFKSEMTDADIAKIGGFVQHRDQNYSPRYFY